ncbi:predicted protein [Chaetoceros tenuissimus]|uniref:Uncharacterized protein n=1 Tax=Chaetoceros tenuissimus TaxID=426638 RepID=A0AAD3CDJ6_9STRA|nr:predicted protein [Chaetoceros tenuissimus]
MSSSESSSDASDVEQPEEEELTEDEIERLQALPRPKIPAKVTAVSLLQLELLISPMDRRRLKENKKDGSIDYYTHACKHYCGALLTWLAAYPRSVHSQVDGSFLDSCFFLIPDSCFLFLVSGSF